MRPATNTVTRGDGADEYGCNHPHDDRPLLGAVRVEDPAEHLPPQAGEERDDAGVGRLEHSAQPAECRVIGFGGADNVDERVFQSPTIAEFIDRP